MVPSRIYFSALLGLGKIFDQPLFFPLGAAVRFLHGKVVAPVLTVCFRRASGEDTCQLEVRHSARSGIAFNPFFSDLDLTVIVAKDSEELSRTLRWTHARARRWLPFLGELEIYSSEERKAIQDLLGELGPLFTALRELRKLGWMETAAREAKHEYHRWKAHRSILKTLGHPLGSALPSFEACLRLGYQPVRRLLETRWNRVKAMDIPNFAVFCNYLGLEVGTEDGPGRRLCLPPKEGIFLLALVPFDPLREGCNAELAEAIARIRKEDPVAARQWRALSCLEAHIMDGVYRALPERFPWMPEWSDRLRRDSELVSRG